MSDWDVDKYREEHESDEHWELRKAFMERWKGDYNEERLVCLARIFTNIEFMGCKYPSQVMHEVARLSQEVAKSYRDVKKTKLQRTFVSASDAAEDRARGVKREGGVVISSVPQKSTKIDFVRQGTGLHNLEEINVAKFLNKGDETQKIESKEQGENNRSIPQDVNDYLNEMIGVKCLSVQEFRDSMFNTAFGRIILLVRPWIAKASNIQNSCQVCNARLITTYENGCFSLLINGVLVARASGSSKSEAKSNVETMAWNRLRGEVISVMIKEVWIAQDDKRISVDSVSGKPDFGTPLDSNVATKIMKLMGWKGGGLGSDSQGIAEPITPSFQMVNRAGLGSQPDINQLRRSGLQLMRRYLATDTLDVDLVFSSDFSKEERAALHQCAQRCGLASRSYGDVDRFLVVRKKLDPFTLVKAVIEKGGETPKYKVFIPISMRKYIGR